MVLEFRVSAEESGLRLDKLLAQHAPTWSRTRWQAQLAAGRVQVDGRVVAAPAFVVAEGHWVAAQAPEELAASTDLSYEPLPVEVPIRYQDESLLVVAKPAGVVVHPAAGHAHGTLVQALWPALAGAGGPPTRVGVVHRLDRDTAGLMMLARTAAARTALSAQLARREVHRRYWALVQGAPMPPEGRIDAPIGRHPRHRQRMAVIASGRPAVTRYRTLATWAGYSWLALELETGRTHQVRVHLAALGYPVVADPVYGSGPALGLEYQALFAYALAFLHPVLPRRQVTVVEPWPLAWSAALAMLGDPAIGAIPERSESRPVLP